MKKVLCCLLLMCIVFNPICANVQTAYANSVNETLPAYEYVRSYYVDGKIYHEANLLENYNGVPASTSSATTYFFMDESRKIVTNAEILSKLYTMLMFAECRDIIQNDFENWMGASQIWGKTAFNFMSEEAIYRNLGSLSGGIVRAIYTGGSSAVADTVNYILSNATDADLVNSMLQLAFIDQQLNNLRSVSQDTITRLQSMSTTSYNYDEIEKLLELYKYSAVCYESVRGVCIPIIEEILKNYESDWEVGVYYLGEFAKTATSSALPEIKMFYTYFGTLYHNELTKTNFINTLSDVLSVFKGYDPITYGLGFFAGALDAFETIYGIDVDDIDRQYKITENYYPSIEKIQSTQLYKNQLALSSGDFQNSDFQNSDFQTNDFEYTVAADGTATITDYTGNASYLFIPKQIDGHTVTTIGGEAFYACTTLVGVSIPNSVTAIEYAAFRGCSSLKAITIPNSVTTIGTHVFQNCHSLETAIFPEEIERIGTCTFDSCYALKQFTIPKSVTTIGSYAFDDCRSLTKMVIPKGIDFYSPGNVLTGCRTFTGCSSLTAIIFEGDAPRAASPNSIWPTFEEDVVTLYYYPNNSGWSTPTWNGYKCYPLTAPIDCKHVDEYGYALYGTVLDTWQEHTYDSATAHYTVEYERFICSACGEETTHFTDWYGEHSFDANGVCVECNYTTAGEPAAPTVSPSSPTSSPAPTPGPDESPIPAVNANRIYHTLNSPVDIDILDQNGKVVYTVKDSTPDESRTDYALIFVTKDADSSYPHKTVYLSEDYTITIRGVANGKLDFLMQDINNLVPTDTFAAYDVPVTAATTATLKEDAQTGKIVLVIDSDSDGIVDQRLPLTPVHFSVNDHDQPMAKVEAIAPTCSSPGRSEYHLCSCGKMFSHPDGKKEITDPNSLVIPATNQHAYHDSLCIVCGDKEPPVVTPPKTGDSTPLGMLTALAAFSLLGMGVFASRKRRNL